MEPKKKMTFEEVKAKNPDLNWKEAEEVSQEDLEAAASLLDHLAYMKHCREEE